MHHAIIFNVNAMGAQRPPGAHRIASFLREQDWDVEVIDYADQFKPEELEEVVKSRVTSKTVFIGFSCFFAHWSEKIDNLTHWIKANYPNVPMVLGGQSKPRMTSRAIDYYVHGFGEYAILELIKSLTGNGNVTFDPLYFGDRKVISANKFYPAFPMKSLRIKYEERDLLQPWEWLTVEFGRGCKFKCAYCNFPNLGVKGDHTRDAEDFEAEMLDNYQRWGISQYYVADETFNDRIEKIEKFANVADTLPFKPFFSGFIRADLMISRKDRELDLLSRLGFFGHFYGVETMSARTAKVIGKGMNPEKLQHGLLEAKEYLSKRGDYRGDIGVVVGLPYETIESQLNTLDWISKNWRGECVHVWPLEIPLDPKIDVLSSISEDYQKYGYRPSNGELPRSLDEEEFKEFGANITRIKHGISNLNWENNDMSFRDACQISNDFHEKIHRDEVRFGISMFTFSDHMIYNSKTRSEVLQESMLTMPPNTWEHHRMYIESKLK